MFEKGHKPHPTKNGLPGMTKRKAKFIRSLAAAIQENMPAEVLYDYYVAVAEGFDARLGRREGVPYVIRGSGPGPDQEQRTRAMSWLADRGFGTPVQTIQLDASLRNQPVDPSMNMAKLSAFTPEQLAAMRDNFRLLAGNNLDEADQVDNPTKDEGVIDVPGSDDGEDSVE